MMPSEVGETDRCRVSSSAWLGPLDLTYSDNVVRTGNKGDNVRPRVRRCHVFLHCARRIPTLLDCSTPQIQQLIVTEPRNFRQLSLDSNLLHIDKWHDDLRRSTTTIHTLRRPHQDFGNLIRDCDALCAQDNNGIATSIFLAIKQVLGFRRRLRAVACQSSNRLRAYHFLVVAMMAKASLTSSEIRAKLPESMRSLLQSQVPPTAHDPALI